MIKNNFFEKKEIKYDKLFLHKNIAKLIVL